MIDHPINPGLVDRAGLNAHQLFCQLAHGALLGVEKSKDLLTHDALVGGASGVAALVFERGFAEKTWFSARSRRLSPPLRLAPEARAFQL